MGYFHFRPNSLGQVYCGEVSCLGGKCSFYRRRCGEIFKFFSSSTTTLTVKQFHSRANIKKMQRGEPLTDADRQGWLDALSNQASNYERENESRPQLIITCSALKREYRDVLRMGCERAGYSTLHLIHLDAPESELCRRTEARPNHFAQSDLVHSQFQVLEKPGMDETDTTLVSVVPPPSEVRVAVLTAAKKAICQE